MSSGISRVLVAGGRGYIGDRLVQRLLMQGKEVTILTNGTSKTTSLLWRRKNNVKVRTIPYARLHADGLPECDAVVMAGGASLMRQAWTPERKEVLRKSRVGVTRVLVDAINKSTRPPKLFVGVSSVAVYPSLPLVPSNGDAWTEEDIINDTPSNSFASQVFLETERASEDLTPLTRSVVVRLGNVLGSHSPFLTELAFMTKVGFFNGVFGNGQQYWPWVDVSDVTDFMSYLLDHAPSSAQQDQRTLFNLVAPAFSQNVDFASLMRRHLNRFAVVPMPAAVCRFFYQERADLLLRSLRVSSTRIPSLTGFRFSVPTLDQSLEQSLGVWEILRKLHRNSERF